MNLARRVEKLEDSHLARELRALTDDELVARAREARADFVDDPTESEWQAWNRILTRYERVHD